MTDAVNLGWLFYKEFYKVLSDTHYKEVGKKILDYKFKDDCPANNGNPAQGILLKTTYPGLLIGSGYQHESHIEGVVENEFKIGFFFDYTTGLPQIPGSSVKGVLRSVFPNSKDKTEVKKGKLSYLNEMLKAFSDKSFDKEGFNTDEIKLLEKEIFEGEITETKEDGNKTKRHLSIYKRDIFYDAVIATENPNKKIMGSDYITPHRDPLKNPTPLMFLKVLPEILIKFQFSCQDSIAIEGFTFTAVHKVALFKQILLDFGVGAKTNVGYGQFDVVTNGELNKIKEEKKNEIENLRKLEIEKAKEEAERIEKEKKDKENEERAAIRESQLFDQSNDKDLEEIKYEEKKENIYLAEIINENEGFFQFQLSQHEIILVKARKQAEEKTKIIIEKRIKKKKNHDFDKYKIGTDVNLRVNKQTGQDFNFTVIPIWK